MRRRGAAAESGAHGGGGGGAGGGGGGALLAAGFAMADVKAEYEAAQAVEMAEKTVILKSIQDEAYVKSNRQFILREQAATEVMFAKLNAEGNEVP